MKIFQKEVFEMIVPKKFVLEHSKFMIDSYGNIFHEVDLAMIGEMYTPYIFCSGCLKFVPIEAVVVVERKSILNKYKGNKKWHDVITN